MFQDKPMPSPRFTFGITTLVVIIVVSYLVLLRVDTYLRNSAVDNCAKISKFEKQDKAQSAVISYPIKDVYQECLIRKGL